MDKNGPQTNDTMCILSGKTDNNRHTEKNKKENERVGRLCGAVEKEERTHKLNAGGACRLFFFAHNSRA